MSSASAVGFREGSMRFANRASTVYFDGLFRRVVSPCALNLAVLEYGLGEEGTMTPRKIVLVLLAMVFCGMFLGAVQQASSPTSAPASAPAKEVTFNRDVAPILYKNCVVCHRPND